MLWDGLGFFGTDHMKLGRLRGEKVNFCTFIKSPKSIALTLAGIGLGIYLLITELAKLGTLKSQQITLVQDQEFNYHFSDAIALHSGNWFYVDKVF